MPVPAPSGWPAESTALVDDRGPPQASGLSVGYSNIEYMFENELHERQSAVAVVRRMLDLVEAPCPSDAVRIDRLAAIEAASSAVAALGVVESVAFADSQIREQERLGVPARIRGRGIGEQIGLATRQSPAAASRRLAVARTLVAEMPATLGVMAAGGVSEHAVTVAVREAAYLDPADRSTLDTELAGVAETMSVREVERAVRRRVIDLDIDAVVRRAARARADRYVSLRPAPDCMAQLTALLPVEHGVAVEAALRQAAMTAHAGGDERTLAQVKADTLVQRVTGQTAADGVSVEIGLVMTSDALLGRTEEPARLAGMGPIPAQLARQITCHASQTSQASQAATADATGPPGATTGPPDPTEVEVRARRARAWVRRILTDPVDGTVTSIDTRRRRFSGALAVFLRLRDQNCRDPYCDAPIRDLDHLHGHAQGGATSSANGQGLCQRGNLVREMPGWSSTGTGRHRQITTPTGHVYDSHPPPALGPSLTATVRARVRGQPVTRAG